MFFRQTVSMISRANCSQGHRLTQHRVNSLDRFLLTFYKKYPKGQVPEFVPQAVMEKARNKGRIHFNIFMVFLTLGGIYLAVKVGNRDRAEGRSLYKERENFHGKESK